MAITQRKGHFISSVRGTQSIIKIVMRCPHSKEIDENVSFSISCSMTYSFPPYLSPSPFRLVKVFCLSYYNACRKTESGKKGLFIVLTVETFYYKLHKLKLSHGYHFDVKNKEKGECDDEYSHVTNEYMKQHILELQRKI